MSRIVVQKERINWVLFWKPRWLNFMTMIFYENFFDQNIFQNWTMPILIQNRSRCDSHQAALDDQTSYSSRNKNSSGSDFIYRLNKIIWLFCFRRHSQTGTLFSNHITPGRLENLNNFIWFCFQSIAVYRFFRIAWLKLKISK